VVCYISEKDFHPKEEEIMLNPTVDKDLCVSCGLCSQVCPEVFEEGPDGTGQVKADADLNAACIQDAVDQCPVGAISA